MTDVRSQVFSHITLEDLGESRPITERGAAPNGTPLHQLPTKEHQG